MRVVAGLARGRRLRAPKGSGTRPTADRVKEALFSMLESRDRCAGVTILDLFAGTGGLGIEALSRGAGGAVFVESNPSAAKTLRANLATAGFDAEVLVMPAARAITALGERGARFDGVFLDPPYERAWIRDTLERLDVAGLVRDDGWVVVEHGRDEAPPARVGHLVARDTRRYGDTRLTLLEAEGSEVADGA
jgi:16S rRNA (guanine966-N2)-methyltransferase